MVGIVVVTRAALLIARCASTWTIDEHLGGLSPECVAVDLRSPAQVYCGTARDGLFRSRDSGRNWKPVGPGIDHPMITAVDVGYAGQADGLGIVYAGTEPSAVFRSDNGGDSWVDLAGLRALPSADTIRSELDEELPNILADRVQLQQEFMNLMLNAIEAMKDGGEMTIMSGLNQEGQLLISISDTGVGLPLENTEWIFDAFHTTKPQGTGMGLAITRSIVESYGGRIWATANQGAGATFHFTLPIEAEAQP